MPNLKSLSSPNTNIWKYCSVTHDDSTYCASIALCGKNGRPYFKFKMTCKSTYIFMCETSQNFNFSKCPLAICLMFKWWYLLNSNLCARLVIICGPAVTHIKNINIKQQSIQNRHNGNMTSFLITSSILLLSSHSKRDHSTSSGMWNKQILSRIKIRSGASLILTGHCRRPQGPPPTYHPAE